ncbi:hypothetical protein [Planctomicrobium piriforme]|uniref:Uncharacterized protein n=1 Tax=Planctomicrobium piriforme TaxID=1576369 RepID=A0A1I3G7Q6_9PLAN|nr:hypothetical protein [Planctomicrobium piriforme]SFI19191.1 hypothetical protein SAMN05421753_106215 [Planctomicrobium piriforme]
MKPKELYNDMASGFEDRQFSAGLLVAFIDFFVKLNVPNQKLKGFEGFLKRFPRLKKTKSGKHINTLRVKTTEGESLSLRPFYNNVELYFRAEHKRFDHPSCAPHATQAWADYTTWLDALCTYSLTELESLREMTCRFVLDKLPSHAFLPGSLPAESPQFQLILANFDLSSRSGEKTGAAFQGIAFGFLRADNPHLQIEIDKVRTGSKRLQRIGDIDGWEGNRLAISAEVKQFHFTSKYVSSVAGFANAVRARNAIGIVFALKFDDAAYGQLEQQGVHAVDLKSMQRIVELWDSMKQRTAVASLVYYVNQVEKSSSLASRLDEFLGNSSTT